MIQHKKTRNVFAALWLVTPVAWAQSQAAVPLESVVVTATRAPQRVADALSDVTVIDEAAIRESGSQSMVELLQRESGIQISQTGGPGSVSGVFLRGANSGQTVVLIDGLRMVASTLGAATFEAIPLDQIRRIEIVRGPASALYGADAIGGVIQIFTRQAEQGTGAAVSAAAGRYGYGAADAQISAREGAWRFALSAGHARADGFNAIVNPSNFQFNADRDGYRSSRGSVNTSYTLNERHTFAMSALESRLNAQFDAGADFNTGALFDDRAKTTLRTLSVSSVNRFLPRWKSTLRIGRATDDAKSDASYGSSHIRTDQDQIVWQNEITFNLLGKDQLLAAIERREENVSGDTDYVLERRTTKALLAGYEVVAGSWSAQANVRSDDSSQFGRRNTGGASVGYGVAPGWRVIASAARSFKAPTFNDLYFPFFGNPALRPERARNVEAAIAWQRADWDARLTLYRNRVDDLIVTVCDDNFNCAPENARKAELKGASLRMSGAFGDTRFGATLDWLSPEDRDTGRQLPRRAKEFGALNVSHVFGLLRAGVELIGSGERFDDAANARRLPGYWRGNLFAEYEVTRNVKVMARVDNVNDTRYQLARDYATPGRSASITVRASF